jgi:hypothetical protein
MNGFTSSANCGGNVSEALKTTFRQRKHEKNKQAPLISSSRQTSKISSLSPAFSFPSVKLKNLEVK